MPPEEYSVSEFITILNRSLDALSARVIGEVSELKMAASGHAYFTLKDKDTGFILPCTIWARDYAFTGVQLELGTEIAAVGKANFYGPFGKLSFNAKSVELVGEGALKKAYEMLKKKLTLEGLFAEEKKRSVPPFVRTIGIITSVHGAVIHDFSNNLGKYGFQVRILNSKVEGPESGRDLALSVRAMRTEDIDILVIIRGGGSIQSLAGFDNEALVREIATFPVPVLAGVGHHQDVTLAALAADAAESTPSLIATLINRSWIQAESSLRASEQRIMLGYQNVLSGKGRDIAEAYRAMNDAFDRILDIAESAKGALQKAVVQMEFQFKRTKEGLDSRFESVTRGFQSAVEAFNTKLANMGKLIAQNDPERQLKLGYSIVYAKGRVVRSTKDVQKGSLLELRVVDGTIEAEVT